MVLIKSSPLPIKYPTAPDGPIAFNDPLNIRIIGDETTIHGNVGIGNGALPNGAGAASIGRSPSASRR